MVKKDTKNKKIASFFLALLTLLAFSSCSGAEIENERNDNDDLSFSSLEIIPTDTQYLQAGNNIIYPLEFKVLCESGTEENFFASVEDTDIFSKTVFERNARLFEEYGITLSEISEIDIVARTKADMLSEDKSYDMLLLSSSSSASLISAGALADLDSIPIWSPKLSGYSEQIITDLAVGGRIFLAAGDATPSLLRSASAVLVNTDLAKKIGIETSIFYTAKNGHFTYGTMLSHSKSIADLNGIENTAIPSAAIHADPEKAIDLFLSGEGRFFTTNPVTDVVSAVSFEGSNSDIYNAVMSLFGISQDGKAEENGGESQHALTPLFTVSNIGELESLASENAPFSALPMPKFSVIQTEYHCNIDFNKAVFTALPLGSGEKEAAVMNLIYGLSDSITDSILNACDTEGNGTAEMVYKSMVAEVLSLFEFGDLRSFMASCVNERTSSKNFAMRAEERSIAATAALSIIAEKYSYAKPTD